MFKCEAAQQQSTRVKCIYTRKHGVQELSQLWGHDIFARKYMYEKLTKCPNFT